MPCAAAMSYTTAIAQLNSLVPELYAPAGKSQRRFSIDEIRILLEALGNPHHHFKPVLIAGTNGKGSTASTLASILSEAGLRTGLYTSPSASGLVRKKSQTTTLPAFTSAWMTPASNCCSPAAWRNCPAILKS
jgi:hypothetical protein